MCTPQIKGEQFISKVMLKCLSALYIIHVIITLSIKSSIFPNNVLLEKAIWFTRFYCGLNIQRVTIQ